MRNVVDVERAGVYFGVQERGGGAQADGDVRAALGRRRDDGEAPARRRGRNAARRRLRRRTRGSAGRRRVGLRAPAQRRRAERRPVAAPARRPAPDASPTWRPVPAPSRRRKEARRVIPRRRSAPRNVPDAAAHDSGRMMRTMDPFWTSSGASRLDKAAAPRAGGATSALALAASAAKQATLNISTEKVAARLSGPPRAPQISLDQTLNVSQRAPRTQIASRVAYATTPVVVFYVS